MSITDEDDVLATSELPTRNTRRRLGVTNPVVWITVAWAGMLTFFMLGVPIYQAPDEHTHVDRILSTSVSGFHEYDELRLSPEVIASGRLMGLSARPDPFRAEDAPARPLPTFAELSSGLADPAAVNQLAGHPPAYYALMGGARTLLTQLLPRDSWQLDRDVLLLRLLNVLLMLGLPVVLARTARNLGMPPWQAWIAAALPLCIPQMAHIGSAVNNDNLLIVAAAVATMFAADVVRRGLLWVPTLGLSLATALAIQTKIFGWAVVPMVAVVCLAALRGRTQLWPRVAVAGAIVVLSSWTYLRSLVLYGHPYPVQAPLGQPIAPDDFQFGLPAFLVHLAANTSQSFVGKFGALWLPLPRVWTLLVSAALLACLVMAVARPSIRGLRVLLIPIAVVGTLYLYTSLVGHLATGQFAGQQGRYLFPVAGSLAVAVASATDGLGPHRAGTALAGIAGVGWLLTAWTVLTGFWAGSGASRISSLIAWSPLGWGVVVTLAVSVVAFWAGLSLALRSGSHRSVA